MASSFAPVEAMVSTVSDAWLMAMKHVIAPGRAYAPMLLSISDLGPDIEDPTIRSIVDAQLLGADCVSVKDNAAMIFPSNLWATRKQLGLERFYDDYINRVLPRVLRRSNIKYGTYFGRLLQSTGLKPDGTKREINQIQFLLDQWEKGRQTNRRPRQSSLQLAVFDPAKDHTGQALRGFPCLQQVGLSTYEQSLTLHAMYPTQLVFDRGYGNYLGLVHLARFLAEQMGLDLAGVNIFVGCPELGAINKAGARNLLATLLVLDP
ncbi:MAG: hypothetical protein ICCCNLDF_03585 [Planctomycetes bacterium]|nr:hypothetical protein [Planctomycetota bacterium]